MRQVWKYPLRVMDVQTIQVPGGAKFLKAMADPHGDFINLWFLLRPVNALESRTFYVYGTGHTIPDGTFLRHLETVSMQNGTFIWHIFEAED